jgi:HEAT repeat protein
LRDLAADDDPARAIGAASLLGAARDTSSIEAISRLARRPRTRFAAVQALVAIGTRSSFEAAISTCHRHGTGDGLAAQFEGTHAAEPLLLDALESGTVAERTTTLRLLARCGGSATLERIARTDWRGGLVREAIETVGAIGSPEAVAILRRWREQSALHPALVDALGATGEPDAVPLLRSFERRQRARVVRALGRIAHPESARALIAMLDDPRDADAVATALAALPTKFVVPALLAALPQRAVPGRAHAVLVRIAGVDVGTEPEDWRRWWNARS